jgi:hypothetical protein
MKKTVVLAAAAALAIVAGVAPSFAAGPQTKSEILGDLVGRLMATPALAAGPQSGAESANIAAGGEAYGEGYIMFLVMCHVGQDKRMTCEMHEMTPKP